jgi:hypothetical protein
MWVKTEEVELRLCFSSKDHGAGGGLLAGRGAIKARPAALRISLPEETRRDLGTRQD